MKRMLLLLALIPFAVGIAHGDDDVDEVLARELPRLADKRYRVREQAHNAVLALGVRAEAAVRKAHEAAKDPEVRARLAAILQSYAIEAEEVYALKHIARAEAFPKTTPSGFSLRDAPVGSLLKQVAQKSLLELRFYPGDKALERRANQTTLGSTMTIGKRPGAVRSAVTHALTAMDATYVVDNGVVVVVRLSPAVFFAKLKRQSRWDWSSYDVKDQARFSHPVLSHWVTVKRFIQIKSKAGGSPRQKWLSLLANRAGDPKEKTERRVLALHALGFYLGMDEKPQPDVDDVFIRHSGKDEPVAAIRHQAYRGLVMGRTPGAREQALARLEKAPPTDLKFLIRAMYLRLSFLSVVGPIRSDPAMRARFEAALASASKSEDPDLAVRAHCLLGRTGTAASERWLAGAKSPTSFESVVMFMRTLGLSKLPECRKRLDRIATHEDERYRAMYMQRTAASRAGGTDRAADLAAALTALEDRSPLVRYYAAYGLGLIFHKSSATPYRKGLAAARAALEMRLAIEKDARVKKKIAEQLKSMWAGKE